MAEVENAAATAQDIANRLVQQHEVNGSEVSNGNKRKFEDGDNLEGAADTAGPMQKRADTGFDAPEGEGGATQAPVGKPQAGFINPQNPSEYTDFEVIPGNMVGKLIGKNGETIKLIQSKTGARIQIDHKGPEEGKPVTVTGRKDQVEEAMREIQATMAPEITETIECPHGIVGRIIGRQGETIKSLQSASEAHIVVNQTTPDGAPMPDGEPRKIVVSGRADSVERAGKMIRELIQGEPGSAQSIIQKYGTGVRRTLDCPKSMVGRVIGKGGETIKALQKQHNVQIQIHQDRDPCTIEIQGNPGYIAKALENVRDIINGGPLPGQAPGGGFGGPQGGGGMPAGNFGGAPHAGGGGFPGGFGGGFPQQNPYGGFPGYGGAAAPFGSFGGFGANPMGGGAAAYGAYGAGAGAAAPAAAGYGAMGYGAQAADPYAGYGGAAAAGGGASNVRGLWQELKDEQGNTYYYNTQTGVSQWDKPEGF